MIKNKMVGKDAKAVNFVTEIRKLLFNYDGYIAFAKGQIDLNNSILDFYAGDTNKENKKRYIEAKISNERMNIFLSEILKRKEELVASLESVLEKYNNPLYRKVFFLHFFEKRTMQEVADLTGYSFGAITKIIEKFRAELISLYRM